MNTNKSQNPISELKEIILSEMSKENTLFVRDIILNNPEMFDQLFKMVIANEEPISRRAIWSMDYCLENQNNLLTDSHILQLIDMLELYKHQGLIRQSLRILARYNIPKSHQGKLISICFDFLLNPKTSIASKAWSMDILYNFSKLMPEIKSELKVAIEFQKETTSAGIKNKSIRLLSKLNKELN